MFLAGGLVREWPKSHLPETVTTFDHSALLGSTHNAVHPQFGKTFPMLPFCLLVNKQSTSVASRETKTLKQTVMVRFTWRARQTVFGSYRKWHYNMVGLSYKRTCWNDMHRKAIYRVENLRRWYSQTWRVLPWAYHHCNRPVQSGLPGSMVVAPCSQPETVCCLQTNCIVSAGETRHLL